MSSVFGKGNALFPNTIYNFAKEAIKNKRITIWGSGERKIQYVFIDDVVMYVIKSFLIRPGIYNLGGLKNISIKNVSKIIATFFNVNIFFKAKKEGENLPLMNTNKINKIIKKYPQHFYESLNKYLNTIKSSIFKFAKWNPITTILKE